MAKVLKCDDVVPGCKIIVEGRDVLEVVTKEAEHVLSEGPWRTESTSAIDRTSTQSLGPPAGVRVT